MNDLRQPTLTLEQHHQVIKELTPIVESYGCTIKLDEREDQRKNGASIAGKDIWCRLYDDPDKMRISIFHEIGHTLGGNPNDCKFQGEVQAWFIGLQLAFKHGYQFDTDALTWANDQLCTYITPEGGLNKDKVDKFMRVYNSLHKARSRKMKTKTRAAIFELIDKLNPYTIGNCQGEVDGKCVIVRVRTDGETEKPKTVIVAYNSVEILELSDESFANEVFEYIQEKNEELICKIAAQ